MARPFARAALVVAATALTSSAAEAQSLGTFRWQLQPFCNVVTLSVTQNGSVFRLEGTDDQCGAGGSASVTGTAFQNPGGGIGFGLNIVSAPGGAPIHVDATVSLPSLSGTWRDSAGSSGNFVFTPGAGSGGSARATGGTIGGVSINPAQVQLRVSGSCTAGLFMQSIGQNGTVGCAAASAGGGITGVSAGPGLFGGGTTGNLVLSLQTAGPGAYSFENVNGLVAHGTFGAGGIGDTGPGTRLLWYPGKAAFRVGRTSSGQWDDANVGEYSAAMGVNTTASGSSSTAFGNGSKATGESATAMGTLTEASGAYSTAMGLYAIASGGNSTAIGTMTTAAGQGSVVMGVRAAAGASANGSFVFGDRSTGTSGDVVTSVSPNQFLVRAAGGVVFWSTSGTTFPTSPGVALFTGDSAWSTLSDANSKENFVELVGEDVLTKLAAMPVREWNYKAQDAAIRHVGPTAQDFHAAFGLGVDPRRIGTVDADGIALAAVKALETRTRELRGEGSALREHVEALKRENDELRTRLARLEALLERR